MIVGSMKKLYKGTKLEEDEFLLKIIPSQNYQPIDKGFLTKLTQKGQIPESFKNWGKWVMSYDPYKVGESEIYIVKEEYKSGWKINSYRSGKSQDWGELIHPDGYTIEVYLSKFFEVIKNNNIIDSEIIGKFRWSNHNLIKKK